MDKYNRRELAKKSFIDAAKQIIETKGIDAVSAREISKISGYSYATLYNYFDDIQSLMAHVAVDYLEDSYEIISQDLDKISSIEDKIIETSIRYFCFMADKPSIFKLVFINQYDKEIENIAKVLVPKVTILLNELLMQIDQSKLLAKRSLIFEWISSSIHTKLMFLVFKRTPFNIDKLQHDLRYEIQVLLGVKE